MMLDVSIKCIIICENKQDASIEIIKVGASPIPHALILNAAIPLLKAKGYNLVVVEFNDYILPKSQFNCFN